MKAHYIAMAGIRGCIPSYCGALDSRKAAVEDLAQMHEMSTRQVRELRKYGFVELRQDQGNEYASIEECDCGDPECHNDM